MAGGGGGGQKRYSKRAAVKMTRSLEACSKLNKTKPENETRSGIKNWKNYNRHFFFFFLILFKVVSHK